MAGLVSGASSVLPASLLQQTPSKSKTLIIAFEKEFSYVVSLIKKNSRTCYKDQKISNLIFHLWNSYESRLPTSYFTERLLTLGDLLCETGHYALAQTHCYGRYLLTHHKDAVQLMDTVREMRDTAALVALLRALIADAMCRYQMTRATDCRLTHLSSRRAVLRILGRLREVSQAALSREPLYWLTHNCLLLIFSICRSLLSHSALVLEFLLWGAVCMESSVPLMASKYLCMRVNFYTAVCQCFTSLKKPQQAELFARRALDKVHELAQLEGASASSHTHLSELVFKEASLKLGVIIFKRSVFLSRKKLRAGFRPKVRPALQELLQLLSPRFPTEKLLTEMFSGNSAQFLAVLEALTDSSRRPLDKAPPPAPVGTDLDQESITDVYQELFCVGLDLAQRSLEVPPYSGGLLQSAVRGGSGIPLESLVMFVRISHSSTQREIVELLAKRLIHKTQVSECPALRSKGKTLELLLMVDSLTTLFNKYKNLLSTASQPAPASTMPAVSSVLPMTVSEIKLDINTTAEQLFSKLQETLSLLHLSVGDQSLVDTDFDLLLDTAVYVWEVASPAFSVITTHDYTSCKQFLSHPSGSQYLVFLAQLVEVFHSLEVWRVDPLLHGELCLKLACLYEARAQFKVTSHLMEGFPLLYDRSLLLECLTELERDVLCVEQARIQLSLDNAVTSDLQSLHAQFMLALTRVRVKLVTTTPPPRPSESSAKPSSLESKVVERVELATQRTRVLSQLTAPTVSVPSMQELREQCGSSHYKTALLTMSQATLDPQLSQSAKQALLEESLSLFSKKTKKAPPTHNSKANTLPPPRLLYTSNSSLTFEPCLFPDDALQSQVTYYKLYGRLAAGSNVRVRLADQSLPGLGIMVPVGSRLCVFGLESNQEYVFAVGAYSSAGELVGGSIGATSQPILSSFSYPLLMAWGELCKCAYMCGAHSIAEKACDRLWTEFVLPSSEDEPFQLNNNTITQSPLSTLREFVQSVLIHTQLAMAQGQLLTDKLCAEGPLRSNQQSRLRLAERMMTALMVYGVLAPLIQYGLQCEPLVELLLHCYAVIGEISEALLLNKQLPGLHHVLAVVGYFLGKVAIDRNKRALFSLITDNARSLLIASMPVPSKPNEPPPSSSEGLQQASLLSGSHSISSFATLSSGLPTLIPPAGQTKKRKSRAKKLTASIDEVSDESKSSEFKAFEGFLLSHVSQTASDAFDLTGQEDPVLLHAVIATQASTAAHKEVHKFRKRPQYLEYFVCLASATLSKGHTDRVLEWCKEAFSWLTRRNEILLLVKSTVPPARKCKHEPRKQSAKKPSRSMSASGSSLSLFATGRRHTLCTSLDLPAGKGLARRAKGVATLGSSLNVTTGRRPTKHLIRENSSCGSAVNVRYHPNTPTPTAVGASMNGHRMRRVSQVAIADFSSSKGRRLQPIMSSKTLDSEIKITRDDVEAKALTIIYHLLPTTWKKHRARKRLRNVSWQELPWRAQANLIQATCHLDQLEKRLGGLKKKDIAQTSPVILTFDSAGVMMDGVIPVYERAVAGRAVTQSEEKRKDLLPLLSELRQLFQHYQRAITLAHRGSHWLLLQNSARSLLNALVCLVHTCSQLDSDLRSSLLAAVYGEALRPLYSAANALLDMLLKCGTSVSGCVLPEASSLHYTPLLDQCDSVGMGVVKRLVFLAVHTLYVHSHWEKTISIIVKFDDITKHSWGDQLVPVLESAQANLASRLSKVTVKRVRIEPAAHLDPGPHGYDVYGGVGHSHGLTAVPLTVGDRTGQGTRGELCTARQLRMRYLGESKHCTLGEVIAAYDSAVEVLGAKGDSDLLIQAMNELGDLLVHSNTSSAAQWWGESLCLLLGTREPLNDWRKRMDTALSSAGLWGCLLAAHIAVKLARHVHYEELDARLEYTLLSASLCKAALSFSLPTPTSDLEFIAYTTDCSPFPGVELFSDKDRLSPHTVLATLSWAGQELLLRRHTHPALPVLWLYRHMAHTVCRDTQHTVLAKLLRLQALTQLYRFEEALFTLSELLGGAGLPQGSSGADKHLDMHWGFHSFSNCLPLSDPKNFKSLQLITGKALSHSLGEMYGPVNTQLLSLCRAQLNTALAESFSPLHHTPVVGRSGDHPSAESTRPLSSLGSSVTTVTPSGSTLQAGTTPSPRMILLSANRRSKGQNIKHTLLQHAEKLLAPLCESGNSLHPDLQIKALLQLAQVAAVYSHQLSAMQLSLATLRTMQSSEQCYDPRLWLEALCSLCHCLIGRRPSHSVLLDCGAQCESAVELCESLGECELGARLHYIAALHHMSILPQSLDTISRHCQSALELLENAHVLSPDAELLRCQITLLLADVSCVPGVRDVEMVTVFEGLEAMLKQQVGTGSENIYLPHQLLLASTYLRLTHTLCLTSRDSADSALFYCREGLALLKNSSRTDPCLLAELLLHEGWLLSLTDEQAGVCSLLEASGAIADCGIHFRLAVPTLYKLAELTSKDNVLQKSSELLCSEPSSPDKRLSKPELKISRGKSSSKSKERVVRRSWLLLKLAVKAASNVEALLEFVSQVNNEEAVKPLPLKVLTDVADFAVLDLCSDEQMLTSLTCSTDLPPIKTLLPSSQAVITTGLNLFKIASYFRRLMEQCSWQKPSLGLSHSDWHLHHHSLTPSIYPKAKALLDFLTTYSQHFRAVRVPSVPVCIFPSKQVQPSTPEPYISAGETELTVVWAQPFPLDYTRNDIIGYFAMNAKSVRISSASSSSSAPGTDSHTVKCTVRALEELYRQWEDLREMTSSFIETRSASRPMSRSPSKQRKSDKVLKMPPEIVDCCGQAVVRLKEVLEIKCAECPKLDLSIVSVVTALLKPYSQNTVTGEAYHFFKALFG